MFYEKISKEKRQQLKKKKKKNFKLIKFCGIRSPVDGLETKRFIH